MAPFKILHQSLGLAAQVVSASFEKEVVILGMQTMVRHTAEDVKRAIEAIVNDYDFDKSKIVGKQEV